MKPENVFLKILLFLFTEQALLFPITLTALVLSRANGLLAIYCLILFITGLAPAIYKHTRGKWLVPAITGIYAALAASIALICGISIGSAVAFICGAIFVTRSFRISKHHNDEISFYSLLVAGILSYPAAAYVYSHVELFSPYLSCIAIPATLAVIGSCFCMNIAHLRRESFIINRFANIPRVTRSSNMVLVIVLIALILFVTILGFVDRLYIILDHLWKFLTEIIMSIMQWFSSLFLNKDKLQETAAPYIPEFPPAHEPSTFLKILSDIIYYLGHLLAAVAVAFILFIVFRKFKKAFVLIIRKLVEFLRRFLKGDSGPDMAGKDYEDEVTSLLKDGESPFSAARRWFSFNRGIGRPYSALRSNNERARWLYKHSVKKALSRGYSIESAMTSRQALEKISATNGRVLPDMVETATNAYNTARYGIKEPSDKEIDTLREFYFVKSPKV